MGQWDKKDEWDSAQPTSACWVAGLWPTPRTDAEATAEPDGAYARGALLILAPWGLDAPSEYARFHQLNNLAAEICATTDAAIVNVEGIS